jgi:ABC-type polysaccharide/polyol phosphate transport system ATPase subunit
LDGTKALEEEPRVGQVSPLIELAGGLYQNLTGRENVDLYATIFVFHRFS